MPGTNQYLPFGTAGGANVISDSAYATLAARTAGFSSGVATSNQLNMVWRQSSVVAAAWGTIVANAGIDALDDGNVSNLAANILTALDALLSISAPVGAVVAFAGTGIPTNWMLCNGASLDRTTYAALFATIGVTYGSTDSSSFNLPELRAEFIRGMDAGRGIDSGRVLGSPQGGSTAAPVGTSPLHINGDNTQTSLIYGAGNPSHLGFVRASKTGEAVTATNFDALSSGIEMDVVNTCTGDAETRPINVAMYYIIKVQ